MKVNAAEYSGDGTGVQSEAGDGAGVLCGGGGKVGNLRRGLSKLRGGGMAVLATGRDDEEGDDYDDVD